jgi:hypothetical protein
MKSGGRETLVVQDGGDAGKCQDADGVIAAAHVGQV